MSMKMRLDRHNQVRRALLPLASDAMLAERVRLRGRLAVGPSVLVLEPVDEVAVVECNVTSSSLATA